MAVSRSLLLFLISFCLVSADANSEDRDSNWPQFRGENCSGVSAAVPVEFGSGKLEKWSLELLPGHSSPSIWGENIFLTGFDKESKELSVLCIDKETGKLNWQKSVQVEKVERGHPTFNPASSTAVTDGERVCAYFGSYGLICYDIDGNQLWDFKLPLAKSYSGDASSPIIWNDRVIFYRANNVDNFLIAIDKTTGEPIWKKEFRTRFNPSLSCAATPVVADDLVIIHCIGGLQAHRLDDGKKVWNARLATTATSTPIVANGHVFVATWLQQGEPDLLPEYPKFAKLLEENDKDNDGAISKSEFPKMSIFHRPEGAEAPQSRFPLGFGMVDQSRDGSISSLEWTTFLTLSKAQRSFGKQKHGLYSVSLGGEGNVTKDRVTSLEDRAIAEVPTPVFYDDRIYMVKNGGIVTCIDATAGKRVFQKRLGSRGTHYASPVIAGDKLYLSSGNGEIAVIDLSLETPKRIATNKIGDGIFATPAVVDGRIYVRTESKLFAFGE